MFSPQPIYVLFILAASDWLITHACIVISPQYLGAFIVPIALLSLGRYNSFNKGVGAQVV